MANESLAAVMSDESSVCSVPGCGKKKHARGRCATHYKIYWRDAARRDSDSARVMSRCKVDGCTRAHEARGMCVFHYNRWLQKRDLTAPHRFTDKFQLAQEAWIRFSESEGDADYEAAKKALERAMCSFAHHFYGRRKAASAAQP